MVARLGILPNTYKEEKTIKSYTKKPTWYVYPDEDEQDKPRDKHATISVIKHREKDFCTVDGYLSDCEQRFQVVYLKRINTTAEQAWQNVIKVPTRNFIHAERTPCWNVCNLAATASFGAALCPNRTFSAT